MESTSTWVESHDVIYILIFTWSCVNWCSVLSLVLWHSHGRQAALSGSHWWNSSWSTPVRWWTCSSQRWPWKISSGADTLRYRRANCYCDDHSLGLIAITTLKRRGFDGHLLGLIVLTRLKHRDFDDYSLGLIATTTLECRYFDDHSLGLIAITTLERRYFDDHSLGLIAITTLERIYFDDHSLGLIVLTTLKHWDFDDHSLGLRAITT